MTVLSVLALAIGLAMDATAVAAARGVAARELRPRHAALVALWFGGFQALLAAAGWVLGRELGRVVADWDHWIAFALLAAIGGKMIHDSRRGSGPATSDEELFGARVMFLLAVATSIDAFAAGITLPVLGAPPVPAIATIGGVTALLSALGLWAGRRLGAALGRRLEVAGGVILIALGVKILIEHTLR